VVIMNAVI